MSVLNPAASVTNAQNWHVLMTYTRNIITLMAVALQTRPGQSTYTNTHHHHTCTNTHHHHSCTNTHHHHTCNKTHTTTIHVPTHTTTIHVPTHTTTIHVPTHNTTIHVPTYTNKSTPHKQYTCTNLTYTNEQYKIIHQHSNSNYRLVDQYCLLCRWWNRRNCSRSWCTSTAGPSSMERETRTMGRLSPCSAWWQCRWTTASEHLVGSLHDHSLSAIKWCDSSH